MEKKVIYVRTNYNNKLGCTVFPHIDLAPQTGIPAAKLESMIFEMRTSDNSHPPISVKLIDLCRLDLDKLVGCLTLPSHGLDQLEFYNWITSQNKDLNGATKMAVYYYKRIED